MRGHTCYGSEVFGDTYQRSIVFAHAITININYKVMKTILYSLSLLISLFLIGCSNSIEKRIEKEFFKYVDENFDDPNSVEEITAISVSDSSNIKTSFDMINSIVNDTTGINLSLDKNILKKVESLSYNEKLRARDYAEDYINKSLKFMHFKIKNDNNLKFMADSINSYISKIKISDYDFLYTYEIKVRLNEDGKKHLAIYYAIINKNDNTIKIQDHKLKVEEVPVLYEITETINNYINLKKEYIKLYNEVKNAENIFIIHL